jgi:SAM-dependent methyltransferase
VPRTEPFDQHADRYDRWFEEHAPAYESELQAVRALLPEYDRALEVGVGTGRFAGPLGITIGVEPSRPMADLARSRGIEVVHAVAEELPFGDSAFDLVLMVTTVCFLDDVYQAFSEAYRVLAAGGHFVVGFLDRETKLGRDYEARKPDSEFYRQARFRSSEEVIAELARAGFRDLTAVQTIFAPPGDTAPLPQVEPGHGTGLFVVVRGRKAVAEARAPN